MIISREIINKKIKFHDVSLQDNQVVIKTFSYEDLEKLIDNYKNILQSKGVRPGYSVVIGLPVNIDQTAIVFACAELGATITIVDYPHGKNSKPNTYVPGSISTKLSLVLPITLLISTNKEYTYNNDKTRILMDVCNSTVLLEEENKLENRNLEIFCKPETTFLKCTSSGTTTTPKVITHTHEFMCKLILRNSKMFYGKMGIIANLNHGSSPATYFLPGLVSENVTDFFHMSVSDTTTLIEICKGLSKLGINLNHLMFPYTQKMDEFFNTNTEVKDCIFYTLSVIKNEWLPLVGNKVKDIISIFGTNETSGHVMINQATDVDFKENTYKVLDDHYKVVITEKNELQVTIPVYNKTVLTGDRFNKLGNKFLHLGRSDLYRINDLELNLNNINDFIKQHTSGELVVDVIKNALYLVLWEKLDNKIIKMIDDKLKMDSNNLHFISKIAVLNQENFMTGVKVDRQLLREYFRNMVNQNTLP